MISPIEDERTIAQQMQHVRERGHLNAYELKVGVDRLSDWREHVRSHPLPAVGLAALGSYAVAKALFGKSRSVKPMASQQADENATVAKSGLVSAVAAMAGTMLTGFAKQYVTTQLRSAFSERKNPHVHAD